MNHQDFQFISYTPTPNDQYMLGIAKVKCYGKLELRFKHVKTKDGTGTFFCCANYTTQDATGEKKYLPCFILDSRSDEEILIEMVREGVNRVINNHKANSNTQPQQAFYPHGLVQPSQQMPNVPEFPEQIPF